ncbi:MAG: hypothetical protein ACLVJZ_02645, partial [[Clostridium] leptum]
GNLITIERSVSGLQSSSFFASKNQNRPASCRLRAAPISQIQKNALAPEHHHNFSPGLKNQMDGRAK